MTDEDLGIVIPIREWHERDTVPSGQRVFYLRSWRLSPAHLGEIVDYWARNEDFGDEVLRWGLLVEDQKRRDVLYVRYAGVVSGPLTPYNRYVDDMESRESHFGRIAT